MNIVIFIKKRFHEQIKDLGKENINKFGQT